jgi:hypothetical protein
MGCSRSIPKRIDHPPCSFPRPLREAYNRVMTKSQIITLIIAAYGAVLSTIAIATQYLSDRVKVKLKVMRNMKTHNAPEYEGMTIVTVDVVNIGRRPATIVKVGATGLYPRLHFVAMDTKPRLPYEITEGQYTTTILNQGSHGRKYKLQQASLFRHWKSRIQFKWFSRKKKASAATP